MDAIEHLEHWSKSVSVEESHEDTWEVDVDDIYELFGLNTTAYLRETCSVEMPFYEKTNKSKRFAFVTVPDHVFIELQKLNGIEFRRKKFLVAGADSVGGPARLVAP